MIKYQEEMWFPNLGMRGETYGFSFFAGLLFLAAAFDVFRVTGEPILMLVFCAFGFFMTYTALHKEVKRRKRVFERIARLKANSVRTVGRLIAYEGGVKRESFRKFSDEPDNSHGYFMSYMWYAKVEYEREDGSVERVWVSGLNKKPKKYMLKDVTVYYSKNKVYVKF